MCGIVGLFLKDQRLHWRLGEMLSGMMATMCDRGPDSAGFAVYGACEDGVAKITVQSSQPDAGFAGLEAGVARATGGAVAMARNATHAVLTLPAADTLKACEEIRAGHPAVRIMATGESIEIYKEVGYPTEVAKLFGLAGMTGSHGIAHTRMATESAVTTLGAHPFSTSPDQCLVHNGSLSNHNNLRRELAHDGMRFETENDSEVAASYLTRRMAEGLSLRHALEKGLEDLDGFYTFVVGTKNGFGVLRDPIACKPAILAETDQYIAFGSEYRALVGLPGVEHANVWEPEPATAYFWER